jgi:hypothetical protein
MEPLEKVPSLVLNGDGKDMLSYPAQWVFVLALPLVYGSWVSLVTWKNWQRPWLFASVTVVALYALYLVIGYYLSEESQGFLFTHVEPPAKETTVLPGEAAMTGAAFEYYVIRAFAKEMFAFAILALPTIWLLRRYLRA